MTKQEYQAAARYWEEKDADSVKLEQGKLRAMVEEYIQSNNTCALATGTGDYVRCTPIEYSWHDGCFWMFSEGGKKFIGLEKNPNVLSMINTRALANSTGCRSWEQRNWWSHSARAIMPMRHIKRFHWTFCANCLLPCISFVSGLPA